MTSASGGVLTISDGTNTIDFYPATNVGWHVEDKGLKGFGSDHISYQTYQSPNLEGAKVGRRVVPNRKVSITATYVASGAADMESALSTLYLLLDNSAEYSRTNGTGGVKATLTYTMHGNSSVTVTATIISGVPKMPNGYASAATYPALNLKGIVIDLELEPYWTDTSLIGIHNLLPDLSPFNSLTGWTGSTGQIAIVAATPQICGPYAVRFSGAVASVAVATPNTAAWAACTSGIYAQYWARGNFTGAGVTVRLQEYIAGVWTNIGAGISPSIESGWNVYYVHQQSHSGNPLRLNFTFNSGRLGQYIDIAGCMIALNNVADVPTDTSNPSAITTTYTMMTNGEDLSLGAGTPPAPSKVSRCYVQLMGQLNSSGSLYTAIKSDAPAATFWRILQQATGSGNVRNIYMGRWSATARASGWTQVDIDQTTSGYVAGANTTVDSTGTGNWGAKGNSLKFTPPATGQEYEVARWDMNNLATAFNLPQGRWRILARIKDTGTSASVRSQGKFDFRLKAGAISAATTERTSWQSIQSCPATPSTINDLIPLGEVDLSFRFDRSQLAPSHYYLSLWGMNRRGSAGDSAWVDALVLLPADEAVLAVSGPTTSYYAPTTGQGWLIDVAATPSYTVAVDTDGATVLDSVQLLGDRVQLMPGDVTLLHWQCSEQYGVWTKDVQQLIVPRVRRRWVIPRT